MRISDVELGARVWDSELKGGFGLRALGTQHPKPPKPSEFRVLGFRILGFRVSEPYTIIPKP